MSIEKINQVKADKGFKIFDVVIYCLIVAIAVVFMFVFVFNDGEQLNGVALLYQNAEVFVYDFENDEYKILDENKIYVEDNGDTVLSVRFYLSSDKTDYNLVTINKTERTADVVSTDCSTRKDCEYMEPVSDTSGIIMCAPHNFKIVPFGYDNSDDGVIPVG